jgi:uncharacterized membrane protein
MKPIRENWLALSFVVASFAVVAVLYGKMVDPLPTHWDLHGNVDGWIAKPWGALILPLTQLGVVVCLLVAPRISPREAPMTEFAGVYKIVVVTLSAFLFTLTAVASLIASGVRLDMSMFVPIASGVVFVVLGNYLGKFRRNFFAGIRTPWTLSNDEVWHRTHRLGGKLMVLSGVATVAAAFVGPAPGTMVLLATLLASSIASGVYSYVIYKKLVPS